MENLGNRLVTRKRVRGYAAIGTLATAAQYGLGLARGKGLVDGFGHVVGGDLLTLRLGAQMIRDGRAAQLYDFAVQATYQQRAVAPSPFPGLNPFITPPYVALVFWPWSFLSQGAALLLWSVLSLVLLGLATHLAMASQGFDGSAWRFAMLVVLSFFPVLEGLMAGNTSLVSLFLFTLIYLALKRRRDGVAGMLLGLELIKPQLILGLFAALVWQRRWRAVAGFLVVGLAWVALSVVLVSWQASLSYLQVLPRLTGLVFEPGFPYSLLSSVYALFLIPLGPAHFYLAMLFGSLAALALVAVLLKAWSGPWKPEAPEFDILFALTLIITCLISQYVQLHDLSILILAAILLTSYWMKSMSVPSWGMARLVFAIVWVTCWLGPLLTAFTRIPLVPVALVLTAWTCWLAVLDARTERQG